MDSASDLDAAANALQVMDGGGTVRGGGVSWKLSKNRKGKGPYLQDPHVHVPVVHPSIVQKRSWSTSQTSLQQQQGSPTGNFGAQQLVRPLRLSNVDEMDYPHSPVLPTTTTYIYPSLSNIRVYHYSLCVDEAKYEGDLRPSIHQMDRDRTRWILGLSSQDASCAFSMCKV